MRCVLSSSILSFAVSSVVDTVLGSMSRSGREKTVDDDVACPARPVERPALDHLRAGQAGAAQPRLVLATGGAQALRGAETASGRRSGDRDGAADREAAAYRLCDHVRRSQGAARMAE